MIHYRAENCWEKQTLIDTSAEVLGTNQFVQLIRSIAATGIDIVILSMGF